MDIDGNNYCPRCMRRLAETDLAVSACPLCGRDPGTRRPPMALDAGTLLAGRYQLCDVIGQGGFGITYAAWDETLGMPVAVKEYFPRGDAARDPAVSDEAAPLPGREAFYADGLARFRRESNLLASLQGIPCVVKVLDFFSGNNTAYIAMEYIHGQPVDRWARENKFRPAELLDRLLPVFDALVRTHSQGVIHRDITPDNILAEEDGSLKLIDFGSAVEASRSTGTALVTRRYAPVEQYGSGYGRQGPWTDVYSLAAVLYALFSGQEPEEAPLRAERDEQRPLARSRTGLRRRQAAVIDRALAVSPEKRIQSMAEFRSLLYGLPLPEEAARRRRLARRMALAAAALLALQALVLLNFTSGLPVGGGLLGSFRGDGVHITGSLGSREERILPDRILWIPVSAVGPGAFRGDGSLRRAAVPGTVRAVGEAAFFGCACLEEASLAEGTEALGASAFGGCGSLRTLSLPDSLERIGEGALPAGAELLTVWGRRGTAAERYAAAHGLRFTDASEITWEIYGGAAAVTSVRTESGRLALPNFVEGVPVTTLSDELRLFRLEEVWLPEFLTAVPPCLFAAEEPAAVPQLAAVRLGSRVREIGARAFEYCWRLETLELPAALERIGGNAFTGAGLTEIRLPDGLREIGRYAFYGTGITSLDIPGSVRSIGEMAFGQTRLLAEAALPETMGTVPEGLFAQSGITTAALPDSVRLIGPSAFEDSALEWIALPGDTVSVGEGAFRSCRSLRFALIPPSVREIGEGAFDSCPAGLIIAGSAGSAAEAYARDHGFLFEDTAGWNPPDLLDGKTAYYTSRYPEARVRVPLYNEKDRCLVTDTRMSGNPAVRELILPPFQTEIRDYAFTDCSALRRVTADGGILRVGAAAFSGCAALQSVPLEKAEVIGPEAFSGCAGLESLSLDGAAQIGYRAFRGCASLRELRFSDLLTDLGDRAFESCAGLRAVALPRHYRRAGEEAFRNCAGLQLVIYPDGAAAEGGGTFEGCGGVRAVCWPPTVRSFDPAPWAANCPLLEDLWFYGAETEPGPLPAGESPAWTVHGPAGSAAGAWAARYGLRFEPLPGGPMPDPREIIASFPFTD